MKPTRLTVSDRPVDFYKVADDASLVVLFHYAATGWDTPPTILTRMASLVGVEGFGMNVALPLSYPRWKDATFHDPSRDPADREFIRAVIDKLGPQRVFLAGFSSGAFMTARYALEAKDTRVKGLGMVAGAVINYFRTNTYGGPAIMFNGTADRNTPYAGSPGMRGAVESAAFLKAKLRTSREGHVWPKTATSEMRAFFGGVG